MAGASVTFVVMAGGRGERLWPLVRASTPKVCLAPDGRRSLLAATIQRLRPAWPGAKWLIVTTKEQAKPVRRVLPPALRRSMLVEPTIRNTAACITVAAIALAVRDPKALMVVVPADHWVGDDAAFQQALRAAIRAAQREDTIVTIGIRPTHPHPGLGYLLTGQRLPGFGAARVYRLSRFVEKPSPAMARRLLAQRGTFWNSGTFVGSAEMFLSCLTEWLPEHTRRLVPLGGRLRRAYGKLLSSQARRAYRALAAVSFDHGVMDHLEGGVVVEGRFAWADLGSWDTWARLGQASFRTVMIDSRNVTVVDHTNHLVAAVGVRDLVIVHTPSATLICRPDTAQAVRDLVARLAADPRLSRYR